MLLEFLGKMSCGFLRRYENQENILWVPTPCIITKVNPGEEAGEKVKCFVLLNIA